MFLTLCGILSFSFIIRKNTSDQFFFQINKNLLNREKSRDSDPYNGLLKDYFKINSLGNFLKFDIKTTKYLNANDQKNFDKLSELTHASLREIIVEKLKNSPQPQREKVSPLSIWVHFFKNINSLKQNTNLKNKEFQIDLEFIPHISKSFSFESEITSNNLINFSTQNTLLEYLVTEKPKFLDKIKNNNVPPDGSTYQYLGGNYKLIFKPGR